MKKRDLIFAIFIYMIYPISSVFMKYATIVNQNFYKLVLFSLSIITLVLFSLLYQKLLKNIDLVKSYIFKSTTIIWTMVYGCFIFKEKLKINHVFGIIIIIIGIILCIYNKNEGEKEK
ncbi:MAG: EamA family transporter [Clostridia bacterium]|nr:EamA family transporter [Clostridia bacterium]